jgi:hypothetical protein
LVGGCHWFGSNNEHAVASYTLGGTVAGLGENTGLTLASGDSTLVIDSGASSFAFPAAIARRHGLRSHRQDVA